MLEHAVYSVISPEGCASILWRSADQARRRRRGAEADRAGSAARSASSTRSSPSRSAARTAAEGPIAAVGDALEAALEPLLVLSGAELRHQRRQKFLNMSKNGAA